MRNISIKRLTSIMLATTIAVSIPAMQVAFAKPMPDGAGVDEITHRITAALVNSVNALIPAWISAMVAFLTRADKGAHVWALKGE